jgi:probable F420-dependent oxidoreductase
MSGGRFELGLGSQVRGNIIRRYGTPWSAPVPRMREYVRAIRAIWTCWQDGGDLDVSGEHYRIDRMQPFFRPDPIEGPLPKIHLGAVGPAMTTLAGEVADGLMTHPTNTAPRYLEKVVRPRMAAGAARAARDATRLDLLVGPLVATGPDAASVGEARQEIRQLLGFLYSTPAYWPSLEMFGWRDRGERLQALSREGCWHEMPSVVDDGMLDAFAPSAPYAEIADLLTERFRGLTDWITFPVPTDPAHDATARRAITALSEGIAA